MYNTTYKVKQFTETYGLEEYLKYLILNNKSANAPYHNLYHTFCVFTSSYHIAKSEKLTEPEIRESLIAALFHDINHSQGKVADKYNVQNSVDVFLKVSKEDEETNNKVTEILKATEYPYIISDEDLSLQQKIIKDSDMSQIITDNYFQQCVLGLSEELGIPLKTFLPIQLKFLNSVVLYTDYANTHFLPEIKQKIKEVEYFINLLGVI